ncbi:TraB family protein [Planctomycetes bacterium Poly30]|uniref:TraB family protein n=1 Tax=Saltatorellus ferox TaxID=2528018 RepID=A0A518EUF9_9BACT|nr:TraB family protein [Planctomycetes bacterium Poly30]
MAHATFLAALGFFVSLLPGQSPARKTDGALNQDVISTPFLYQIDGKGTSGFLYGTVHLPDKRVVTLPVSVVAAFDGSDRFYAEIEATPESEARGQAAAQLPAGVKLPQLVGADTWSRIEGQFIKAGYPAAMASALSGMEPWAVSSLLPMIDYLAELQTNPPLDKMLYQRAAADGKAVAGLETIEEQLSVFQGFSRDEQVTMLRDSLDLLDKYEAEGRKVMEEMIAAWMSGDSKTLVSLLDDGFGNDPEIRERAEDEILWKRNHRFAERIESEMSAHPDKTSFFAIGALHLPDAPAAEVGPDAPLTNDATPESRPAQLGVVELMRRRGYTVTRVEARKPEPAKAGK